MFGHFLSFNIPLTRFFVKLIKNQYSTKYKSRAWAFARDDLWATSTSPAKALHCTEKPYPADKSPVLKVFKGGLRLLPAACVALRAGPALPRKRKILIISLQSQPTLVGWTHNTETVVIVAVVRVVVVPIRHGTVGSIVVPRAATLYAVRTRRRAGLYLFIRT